MVAPCAPQEVGRLWRSPSGAPWAKGSRRNPVSELKHVPIFSNRPHVCHDTCNVVQALVGLDASWRMVLPG
ncbi:MAG: hypothetical protein RLZZ568_2130 [Cyanobacteriota bacterium]|jgi:hypothetical protein